MKAELTTLVGVNILFFGDGGLKFLIFQFFVCLTQKGYHNNMINHYDWLMSDCISIHVRKCSPKIFTAPSVVTENGSFFFLVYYTGIGERERYRNSSNVTYKKTVEFCCGGHQKDLCTRLNHKIRSANFGKHSDLVNCLYGH